MKVELSHASHVYVSVSAWIIPSIVNLKNRYVVWASNVRNLYKSTFATRLAIAISTRKNVFHFAKLLYISVLFTLNLLLCTCLLMLIYRQEKDEVKNTLVLRAAFCICQWIIVDYCGKVFCLVVNTFVTVLLLLFFIVVRWCCLLVFAIRLPWLFEKLCNVCAFHRFFHWDFGNFCTMPEALRENHCFWFCLVHK